VISFFGWQITMVIMKRFCSRLVPTSVHTAITSMGSMKGYFTNRRDMFKPLFSHKNSNVVKWAKTMYKSEGGASKLSGKW
jgi:hypothetical protein